MQFIELFIGLLGRFISMVLCRRLPLLVYFYGLSFWRIACLATSELFLGAKKLPRLLLHAALSLDYPSYNIDLLRRLSALKRRLSDSLRLIPILQKSSVATLKALWAVPSWGHNLLCYIVRGVGPDGGDGKEEGSDGENPDRVDDAQSGGNIEATSECQEQQPEKEQRPGCASEAEDSTHQTLPPKKRRYATPEEAVLAKRPKTSKEIPVDKGSQLEEAATDPKFESQLVSHSKKGDPAVKLPQSSAEALEKDEMESTSTKKGSVTNSKTNETEGLAARIWEYASNRLQESATPTKAIRALAEGLEARLIYARRTMPREGINTIKCPPTDATDTRQQDRRSLTEVSHENVKDDTPRHQVQPRADESANTFDQSQTTEKSDSNVSTNKLASDIIKYPFKTPETDYTPPTAHAPKMRSRKTNMFARSISAPYPRSAVDLRSECREAMPTKPSLPPESPASPTPTEDEDLQIIDEFEYAGGSNKLDLLSLAINADEAEKDFQQAIFISIRENSARPKESEEEAAPESAILEGGSKERIIGEVSASDEDTITYAEGGLAQANVPPEMNPPKTDEKNTEVECSYKRKKFRSYPGIAKEPFKVKKDARYQKKFYKKKPVILPRKMGKAIRRSVDPVPYRLVSDQIEFEVLSPEERNIVSEWIAKNRKYVQKYVPEQNSDDSDDSPSSPVGHEKIPRVQSSRNDDDLPSGGQRMQTSGYTASSFSGESPSSSESPKHLSPENEREDKKIFDQPSFIKALEKIKSRSEKAPKKLTTSPEIVKISTSQKKSAFVPLESHRSYPGTDPRKLERATLRFNEDLSHHEGVIYYRNYFPCELHEQLSYGCPILRPLFKIVCKTVGTRDTSVEEFLALLVPWRKELLLKYYKGNPDIYSWEETVDLCTAIPIRSRELKPDDEDYDSLDQKGKKGEPSDAQSIPTNKGCQRLESSNGSTRNKSVIEYVEAQRTLMQQRKLSDSHSNESADTITYMPETESISGASEGFQEDSSNETETTHFKIMKTETGSQISATGDQSGTSETHEKSPPHMQCEKSEAVGSLYRTDSAKPSQQHRDKTDDGIQKAELKNKTKCLSPGKVIKGSHDFSTEKETCLSSTKKDFLREICHILQSPASGRDQFSKEPSGSSSASSSLNKEPEVMELSPMGESKDISEEPSTLKEGPDKVRELSPMMDSSDIPEGSEPSKLHSTPDSDDCSEMTLINKEHELFGFISDSNDIPQESPSIKEEPSALLPTIDSASVSGESSHLKKEQGLISLPFSSGSSEETSSQSTELELVSLSPGSKSGEISNEASFLGEDPKVAASSTHHSSTVSEHPSTSKNRPEIVTLHPATDISEESSSVSREPVTATMSPTGSSNDASEELSSSTSAASEQES